MVGKLGECVSQLQQGNVSGERRGTVGSIENYTLDLEAVVIGGYAGVPKTILMFHDLLKGLTELRKAILFMIWFIIVKGYTLKLV